MHTILVMAGGFVLLGICLVVGRMFGAVPTASLARAALVFIPLWLIAALVNMWIGVSKAGYSVVDEAPIFGVVFVVPAAVAVFLWWRFSRA